MKNLFIAIIISCFFSCSKLVDIGLPTDRTTADMVFTDDATANSAVTGLYSRMMNYRMNFTSGAMTLYPALSSDELYNTSPNTDIDAFRANELHPSIGAVQTTIWIWAYNYIYHANACIQGLDTATQVSEAVKKQLTGEVKFLRAFYNFYLVNLFGDIPLITTTAYQQTGITGRSKVEQVYDAIEADLQEAKNLLTASYPSAGRIRVNKWAATALLSRVYLYRQKWQQAMDQATEVINSGQYSLTTVQNTFLSTSNEAILQFHPVSKFDNSYEATTFVPSGTARPAYALTNELLNAFETGDLRKTNWIKSVVSGGVTYYYPFKYKVKGGTSYTEYPVVLRLAEVYLVRAEARAKLNLLNEALQDLEKIRTRAGLTTPAAMNQAMLLDAIEKERRIELMLEWGHRWFDLKRTGRADQVLGAIKNTWQSTDALYPIPQYDIDRNPNLTQNPGY